MFDYSAKKITVEQALGMVKSGDNITFGMAAAVPCEFISKLHTIADKVEDVRVTSCIDAVYGEYTEEKYLKKSFLLDSYFYTPLFRKLHATGRVAYLPNHLSSAAFTRNCHRKTNIFICSAYPPDDDGKVRFSCGNVYEEGIAKEADLVILEVSPNVPRSLGDNYLEYDDVDYIVECDYSLPVIQDAPSTDVDRQIGGHISELIHDGDCVQVGIGAIPNAVCDYLMDKKDLGIHTEMMTTGIMRLMKRGAVNNSRKRVDVGKTVCAFAYGSQEMYEYMHDNPDIIVGRGSDVNDPYVIAKNDNQVSINTTVEIDLTGQCCSESVGNLQISGTGGQVDTAKGAQRSKNGRSIIALRATASVKTAEGGREVISKIVPTLKAGAVVTLPRSDVDYVVTEYGVAWLRGATVSERAEMLINIAHPDFREELREAARELQYIQR